MNRISEIFYNAFPMAKKKAAKKTAARKTTAKKATRKAAATRKPVRTRRTARRSLARGAARIPDVTGAERRDVGGVRLEIGRAGSARVKRMIYQPGFRWSSDMKSIVGTEYCMHAHVGYLAQGEIHIEYPDGCVVEHRAPQIVAIEPGHDGWVVGNEPVVLIEFDFESETIPRLGMPASHRHS